MTQKASTIYGGFMSDNPVLIELTDEEKAKYEYLRKRGGWTHRNIYITGLGQAEELTRKELAEEQASQHNC